jgi:hypothetical protein
MPTKRGRDKTPCPVLADLAVFAVNLALDGLDANSQCSWHRQIAALGDDESVLTCRSAGNDSRPLPRSHIWPSSRPTSTPEPQKVNGEHWTLEYCFQQFAGRCRKCA